MLVRSLFLFLNQACFILKSAIYLNNIVKNLLLSRF